MKRFVERNSFNDYFLFNNKYVKCLWITIAFLSIMALVKHIFLGGLGYGGITTKC